MSGFGIRFGALVRERRGVEGLTQQALASAAFGDPTRKSRISDLEKGKIANPQQSTVDALAVALNLTADDIAACRAAGAGMDPRLLEILSLQFGHDNPDASAEEQEAFLREKAKDYRALSARMDDLREMDERMGNLLSAAEAALAAGDFDSADDRLADAEEMQQAEHTIAPVRKQAAIRTQRADNALLRGDAGRAYEHFAKAAAFVAPFEAEEAAQMRHEYFVQLYKHALRFSGPGFEGAAALSRENLNAWSREDNAPKWAATQNNLALALWQQAARVEGDAGAALLAEAVTAYRAALEVYTRADHPVDWAMTQNNLAAALRNQAARVEGEAGAALLADAVTACRAALEVYTRADHPVDWAGTHNNLANALWQQAARVEGDAGAALLAEAVTAYRTALEVYTRADHPVDWAMTQNNLAIALRDQAVRVEGDAGAMLLAEAVTAYRAALEVRTRADHPVQWAMTQNNLAIALWYQATRVEGDAGAALLAEAVTAYRAALEVRTREARPVQWAMTQENLAIAFRAMADRAPGDAAAHLSAAREAVCGALDVFDPEHMPFNYNKATKLLTDIDARIAALDE